MLYGFCPGILDVDLSRMYCRMYKSYRFLFYGELGRLIYCSWCEVGDGSSTVGSST